MQYSQGGLKLTEQFEGCKLASYPDPATGGDPWTIGYGHTGADVTPGMTCTQNQAEAWLMQDIQNAVGHVNFVVRRPLTQGEFDALVDFCFNCGGRNLDTSTLLRLVNAGDFANAANEFEKWDHAGGKVMAGLLRRRVAEAAEFKS